MSYYVFVDNSNVWIKGKFASAVKQKAARNIFEAHKKTFKITVGELTLENF